MMRPYGEASGTFEELGKKLLPPSIVVLFDSARSAEPPHSSGITLATALIASPDALRVETELPISYAGKALSNPVGNSPARNRSSKAARSGCAARHD